MLLRDFFDGTELKDKLIRGSILSTQEDVKEIKEDMKYLRDKIDKMD